MICKILIILGLVEAEPDSDDENEEEDNDDFAENEEENEEGNEEKEIAHDDKNNKIPSNVSLEQTPKDSSKIIDCLILDSPFANFRGMIHDVIHSQYKVCGCCINIALSGVLKDCKKKIQKDLTLIKPLEAVPYINIPVFYLVGKQDIIARPEKVKELFLKTKSDQKEYHTFEGEHPSHRDKYILKKAILFILNEFDKFSLKSIPSTIPIPDFKNKKERAKFNKLICSEHKTELFLDPPVKKQKQPKKPKESEDLTSPKIQKQDSEKTPLNLSGEQMKQNDIDFTQPPSPSLLPPIKETPKIQPNQGIDAISNNLAKTPKDLPESVPQELPQKKLNLSFGENIPPLDKKIEENTPANLNAIESLNKEIQKSPIVTGNSSPK